MSESTGQGSPGRSAPDAQGVPPARAEANQPDLSGARRRLVALANRFLWNHHDAEDAVQNALLLAERKLSQLSDAGHEWPWLCRIVIQQCHLLQRQHRRRKSREAAAAQVARLRVPRRIDADEQAEFDALLRSLIGELPQRQQTALVLRHLEGMSYAEVARIMEISESTARVHVRAAREALREAIKRRYPEWLPT